jgi:hypothetical protein
MIKLSKLAKDLSVTKATIYNWRLKGDIEFIKSKTNRNFVSLETYNRLLGIKEHKEEYVIIYYFLISLGVYIELPVCGSVPLYSVVPEIEYDLR